MDPCNLYVKAGRFCSEILSINYNEACTQ